MNTSDMTIIPTTTAGNCPICLNDVPPNSIHICNGARVIERSHLQLPISLENEILAELKEIRNLLEGIWAEIS